MPTKYLKLQMSFDLWISKITTLKSSFKLKTKSIYVLVNLLHL